jgi:very-short-patch-repair endonuclease
VVARWQLLKLGYTRHQIHQRLEAGHLHVIHRGVYAVGHRRLTRRGRWMAAVLACGPDAVLSHRDAAALHSLRRSGSRTAIHVTTTSKSKPRPGIHVHNVRRLHPQDTTTVDGIPVTTVHRSLLDYAESERPQTLRWAFEAYDRADLLDFRKLDAVIARNRGRRGIKPLMKLMTSYRGAPDTRSKNERRFLALIREAGLPEPQVNVSVEGIVVDAFWPEHRLIVEVDSYDFHHTPADRAKDRRNQRKLRQSGYEVRRVTDDELRDEPQAVAQDVEAAVTAALKTDGAPLA